jgi:hypothetical protein
VSADDDKAIAFSELLHAEYDIGTRESAAYSLWGEFNRLASILAQCELIGAHTNAADVRKSLRLVGDLILVVAPDIHDELLAKHKLMQREEP